jgi:hypothetical protein
VISSYRYVPADPSSTHPLLFLGCAVLALCRRRHANSVIDSRALIVEDHRWVAVAYRSGWRALWGIRKALPPACDFLQVQHRFPRTFRFDVLRRKFFGRDGWGRWKGIMKEVSGPSLGCKSSLALSVCYTRHGSPRYRFAL